jgi:hypothetical protein
MAFKTRRQNRYEKLRDWGFLPFEAQVLSGRINSKTISEIKPEYLQSLIKDRRILSRKAIKEKWTKQKYHDAVYQDYKAKGLIYKTGKRADRNTPNPWAMANFYGDIARAGKDPRFPDYKSPAPKRKDYQGDIRKFAK